ncbi:MAG TPA: nitroreductase family protein [Deltaproteobacteria bacterium]|nr:nitroreductase family protein [Deltaproteobacteria bacterium]
MNIFGEIIHDRRSVRDFEERAVPLSVIKEIIADACEAPSAGNRQPWGFVVIVDRDMMKRLSDESKTRLLEDESVIRSPLLRMYRGILKDEQHNVFYNAPCLVYITGPKRFHSTSADCSLAASYFMISAALRGLGTCWVDLGSYIRDPGLLEEIGVPDNHRIIAPVIMGYPKNIPERPQRKEPRIFKIIG